MLIDASKKTFPNPEWKPSYGLYFKIRDGKFAKEFDVTKFYDLNSNDKFDSYNLPCGDFGSECLEQFSFKSGLEIVGICSGGVDDTEYYKDGTINCVNNKIENISVTFRRPYPDAHFFRDYNPSNSGTAIQVLESVEILFENKSSQKLQVITINPTGAIFTRQLK
jgi:hypothetical protein